MYKIGLSINGGTVTAEKCQGYKNAGIEMMELWCGAELLQKLDLREAKKLTDEYEIELWSFHLPFDNYDTCEISQRENQSTVVANHCETIKRVADIGIDKFVIHPSGEKVIENRRERMECAKDTLFKLAEVAKVQGGVLAVEDLPRACLGNTSDDILELISAHENLRVCFDTNHLLNEDVCDFVRKVGDKIITLHVSDYDFQNERHWLPGEGDIDWQKLISALKEIGYNGPWMYELGLSCPNSIIRPRDLTYDDIANNARELFAGKKPTTICTRIEGLGMWP